MTSIDASRCDAGSRELSRERRRRDARTRFEGARAATMAR